MKVKIKLTFIKEFDIDKTVLTDEDTKFFYTKQATENPFEIIDGAEQLTEVEVCH